MADSLPSPPTSRSSTPNSRIARAASIELTDQLDRLLEHYLELLDQYSTLQEELSKTFSTGFFSLANAQRTANIGAGRRYGQEGYDGRMKALRRVVIEDEKRSKSERPTDTAAEEDLKTYSKRYTCTVLQHKPANTPENRTTSSKSDILPGIDTTAGSRDTSKEPDSGARVLHENKPDPAYRDPAAWFGILVPQQLRRTQKCFTAAVETAIPSLINLRSAMTVLEQEIWQVRKALGIDAQYHEVKDTTFESTSDPVEEIDKLLARAKVSSNNL